MAGRTYLLATGTVVKATYGRKNPDTAREWLGTIVDIDPAGPYWSACYVVSWQFGKTYYEQLDNVVPAGDTLGHDPWRVTFWHYDTYLGTGYYAAEPDGSTLQADGHQHAAACGLGLCVTGCKVQQLDEAGRYRLKRCERIRAYQAGWEEPRPLVVAPTCVS